MKTELLGQEKNKVTVKVEFETGEFTAHLNDAIREIAVKANVPGFRKGHTPRKIIEMRFGKESLYNEALEKMLPGAIEQIVADYDLETIAAPSLKVDEIREDQPLVCELTFEVNPEVTLPDLEQIEVERLVADVTENMVDEMVAEFRKTHSTLNAVEKAAAENDVVTIAFTTTVLEDGHSAQGTLQHNDVELSDASIRKEIKDALLSKKKGEAAEAEFEVDANYQDKTLAGKKIHYDITVEEIKERVLPEMNPDFYKKVLGVELDTEEAFRSEIKKRMTEHMEKENFAQASNRAIDLISAQSTLEVPDTLLYRQMEYMKERDAAETKRRFNKDMEEVLRLSSISLAEYEQDIRKKAMETVRRTLVLDAIGNKYSVEVQKEELDAEIDRLAMAYGLESAKLRATLFKSQERIMQTVDNLRYDKIAKLLMEKVKVKEVEVLSPAPENTESSSASE